MAYENLFVSESGNTRSITLNRPHVLNALNRATLLELSDALKQMQENKAVRALVITGRGEKSFAAGADITELAKLTPIEAEAHSRLGHRVLNQITNLPFPVIAAVNGYALGGGLELALACDFIYASDNAQFGLVETSLGLIPGFGGLARLVRRVGQAWAAEMIYSACKLSAAEALSIQLVNRVMPQADLMLRAVAYAQAIEQRGPIAIDLAKSLIKTAEDTYLDAANAAEQKAFGFVLSTQDSQEGIQAFLEKRRPVFKHC